MEMLTKSTRRLFVFTDLDDTLFRSLKGEPIGYSIPATVDIDGNTYAHSSIQQQKLLDVMVKSGATIIPVTGRRSCSFLNCTLPTIVDSEYAIVSHGAVILDHQRQLLNGWCGFLEQKFELTNWEKILTETYQHLVSYFQTLDNSVRVRLIVDHGITAYICIKIGKENYTKSKSEAVNKVLREVLQTDMLLHANGRNFAILPPYAQKKVAVTFLKELIGIGELDTVFGIGDSHSDLAFMNESDFLIIPQNAQILEEE